jgi:hypothetical protein
LNLRLKIYSLKTALKKKRRFTEPPPERFCRFLKASKCVQSLKKKIKNSTEPFESSEEYPQAEPSLTKHFFRFCTAKKGSVEKCETLRVQYETFRVQYKTITLGYETLMLLYWTLKVSHFSTEPFFAVQNLKKGFVRDDSACGYSSELSKGSVEFFILFWDFGHIWMLLEIHRTFSLGSVIPLFFQSRTNIMSKSPFICIDILRVCKNRRFFKLFNEEKFRSLLCCQSQLVHHIH